MSPGTERLLICGKLKFDQLMNEKRVLVLPFLILAQKGFLIAVVYGKSAVSILD